jgi:hypothetical protein
MNRDWFFIINVSVILAVLIIIISLIYSPSFTGWQEEWRCDGWNITHHELDKIPFDDDMRYVPDNVANLECKKTWESCYTYNESGGCMSGGGGCIIWEYDIVGECTNQTRVRRRT